MYLEDEGKRLNYVTKVVFLQVIPLTVPQSLLLESHGSPNWREVCGLGFLYLEGMHNE